MANDKITLRSSTYNVLFFVRFAAEMKKSERKNGGKRTRETSRHAGVSVSLYPRDSSAMPVDLNDVGLDASKNVF